MSKPLNNHDHLNILTNMTKAISLFRTSQCRKVLTKVTVPGSPLQSWAWVTLCVEFCMFISCPFVFLLGSLPKNLTVSMCEFPCAWCPEMVWPHIQAIFLSYTGTKWITVLLYRYCIWISSDWTGKIHWGYETELVRCAVRYQASRSHITSRLGPPGSLVDLDVNVEHISVELGERGGNQ